MGVEEPELIVLCRTLFKCQYSFNTCRQTRGSIATTPRTKINRADPMAFADSDQ